VSDYVTIERADNQAMAELIQQRLDEAGIPCRMVPSGMAAIAGAGTAFAVTVPAERADEARELLGN
jgi:Putative prokaryotic signal transducing protein